MSDKKLIVSKCKKTGKTFCMDAKKEGLAYKVTNFIDVTGTEAEKLRSEVKPSSLITDNNLIACRYCGTRKVGSCSCRERYRQCRKNDKYDFQCIYCKNNVLSDTSPKIMYVSTPRYDNIGNVLESMGLQFSNMEGKYNCDIMFLNCGTPDVINADRIKKFVKEGGCLYASDWACQYIEEAFPGYLSCSKTGVQGDMDVDVIDSELRQITGDRLTVKFDMGGWAVVTKTQGKVLLKASSNSAYAGKPIMLSFKYGKGTVFYTSFHNHVQVSDKEKMLLQLLLMKQVGSSYNMSIEQVGDMIGLNIASIKDKFKA